MICTWCGYGSGRRYTRDKEGKIFYYYCIDCISKINLELFDPDWIEKKKKEREVPNEQIWPYNKNTTATDSEKVRK